MPLGWLWARLSRLNASNSRHHVGLSQSTEHPIWLVLPAGQTTRLVCGNHRHDLRACSSSAFSAEEVPSHQQITRTCGSHTWVVQGTGRMEVIVVTCSECACTLIAV